MPSTTHTSSLTKTQGITVTTLFTFDVSGVHICLELDRILLNLSHLTTDLLGI
jgi:hypothetical protein